MVRLDDSPGTPNGTVLGSAEGLIPIFGQTWRTTTGPLISVTVLFAKHAKGQHGKSIFEQLHRDEI